MVLTLLSGTTNEYKFSFILGFLGPYISKYFLIARVD